MLAERENTMEMAIFYAMGIILTYVMVGAISDHFGRSFMTIKLSVTVVGGSILGAFISAPLSKINQMAGFIGIAIGIVIMFVFSYTGLLSWLFSLIPESVIKVVKIIGKVLGAVIIAIAIIIAVVLLLTFWFK